MGAYLPIALLAGAVSVWGVADQFHQNREDNRAKSVNPQRRPLSAVSPPLPPLARKRTGCSQWAAQDEIKPV